MANASGIQHPQGPITLWAPFLRVEGITGRTAQRAILLGNKVMTFQTAPLPGGRKGGRPISRRGGEGSNSGGLRRRGGRGKLRRAHGSGMERMSQFEAQVPEPL